MRSITPFSPLCLLVFLSPVYSQAHEAHSHGKAAMTVAINGNDVSVAFEIAGTDAVGVETAPITPEQSALVGNAAAQLQQAGNVVQIGNGSGCVQSAADVHTEGYDAGDTSGHAGFHAEFKFSCSAEPSELTVTAFDFFEALEAVEIQLIGPSLAVSAEVGPANRSLSW
jgi:hypothetical protein